MIFALIGNQNSGKTTLFNQLTGSNQHVGNFPGVTVEKKEGRIRKTGDTVVDLPGIYSLSPYTAEEVVTRDLLLDATPDGIINIVDATNIQRNLYLTLQLIELQIPMVLALNMMDEVTRAGGSIDIDALSRHLGIPVVPISASRNEGVSELVDRIHKTAAEKLRPQRLDFCEGEVHRAIHGVAHLIEDHALAQSMPVRFAATKLMEGDQPTIKRLGLNQNEIETLEHITSEMETALGTDREAALADMRYTYIERLAGRAVHRGGDTVEQERSVRIDSVLTHPVLAIPIFLCIMGLVFWLTFGVIGAPLSDLASAGIDALAGWVDGAMTDFGLNPVVQSLVIDGIFAGVGSVLSFLPTIIVLFFFLSILPSIASLIIRWNLHGPGGLCHGPPAAQNRPVRAVLRPHAHRLRLLGAGHYGHPDPGQRAGPQDDHHPDALYVLLGQAAHLRGVYRGLLPPPCGPCDDFPVHSGDGGGRPVRPAAEEHFLPGGAGALCHGAAGLPPAFGQNHRFTHVGKGQGIPLQGLYHHFSGHHHHLVPPDPGHAA